MKMPENPQDATTNRGEYQYIEYESGDNTVAVIQDCDNQSAWIQSTVSKSVEP